MINSCKESRQVLRYRKRKQQKTKRAQDKSEYQIYLKIKNILKTALPEKILNEIALKTGFKKRQSQLTPTALISILLLGCGGSCEDVPIAALDVMCLYLRKWFNIYIKKQSLQSKINRPESAAFIKEIMIKLMSSEIDKVLEKFLNNRKKKVHLFSRILIQDSSVISLPETLARIFRGCGGAGSKAAVKCDYIIDQINHLIVKMKCVAGRVPDAALSGDIINYVNENDLIIRDLGYFNLANFSKIIQKKAYFISRLSKSVFVYLNKYDDAPLDLIDYLEKLNIKNKNIDIGIYIGKKDRIFVRLIGVKVPQEVVELRKQQYKKSRGANKELSDELKEWHNYTLMITNIPKEQLSLKSILKLYKIRWQIELFFKNMKSILVVDKMTGKNKFRIICFIYVKLAVTWIASLLYAYSQIKIEKGKVVSRFKFTRWLKDHGKLNYALCSKDFTILLKELERDIDLLYKETKKKRKWDTKRKVRYKKAS